LRYCARPPFALERLSVRRGGYGRIARVRYALPRHKAGNWVGPGRRRKSTQPGPNGVVELSPLEFLERLADLVPPPSLDLLARGLRVFIAADAVASRHALDYDISLRRLESSGAVNTTTEASLFEWLRDAAHPYFKVVQKFVLE
jgi:hypothetical protein